MPKTILITGSTDGIGLETAKKLASAGHHVLLHGRSPEKLDVAVSSVGSVAGRYLVDLSRLPEVVEFAQNLASDHPKIDVLINNAGVLKTPEPITADGLDVRFVVNTLAPCLLTRQLLPRINRDGRIINLSSAAQASVDIEALQGKTRLSDMDAYAQSKLALTIWSRAMARELPDGPVVVAVNPGSLLASKMVKQGFGVAGKDLSIGAEILVRAALSEEFAGASGLYFDNDSQQFRDPHRDALDADISATVVQSIESTLARYVQ